MDFNLLEDIAEEKIGLHSLSLHEGAFPFQGVTNLFSQKKDAFRKIASRFFIVPQVNQLMAAFNDLHSHKYFSFFVYSLPLLEPILRRLFVITNQCPDRLLEAQASQLMTTLDVLLDEKCNDKEPNLLHQFFPPSISLLLLDLFYYDSGVRIRDLISHGAVSVADKTTIPKTFLDRWTFFWAWLLAQFDEQDEIPELQILLKKSPFMSHYFPLFHLKSLLFYKFKEACEKLQHFRECEVSSNFPSGTAFFLNKIFNQSVSEEPSITLESKENKNNTSTNNKNSEDQEHNIQKAANQAIDRNQAVDKNVCKPIQPEELIPVMLSNEQMNQNLAKLPDKMKFELFCLPKQTQYKSFTNLCGSITEAFQQLMDKRTQYLKKSKKTNSLFEAFVLYEKLAAGFLVIVQQFLETEQSVFSQWFEKINGSIVTSFSKNEFQKVSQMILYLNDADRTENSYRYDQLSFRNKEILEKLDTAFQ